MKWLAIAGILLYLTRHGDAAAVKCSPDSQDPSCAPEKRQLLSPRKASRNAECLAGSEWESNCHSCRCSDAGVAQCVKQEGCELAVFKEPIKCKPRTTFRRDCNRCTCLESGNGLCTLMECIDFGVLQPTQEEVTVRRKRQAGGSGRQECKPNTTWKEDCNSCGCFNGVAVCTKKGCLTQRVKREEADEECKEGSTWMDECNSCTCMQGSALCTRMECYPEVSHGDHLQKRDTTSANAVISRKTRASQEGSKECQPSVEFRMDCNKCLCNDEGTGFSCTRMDCAAQNGNGEVDSFSARSKREVEQVDMKCVPDSVFDRGCNVCRCTAEGLHAVCSLKPCRSQEKDEPAVTTDPSFRCTPGDQFKRECNDCTCSADGKNVFCTLRLCDVELDEAVKDTI